MATPTLPSDDLVASQVFEGQPLSNGQLLGVIQSISTPSSNLRATLEAKGALSHLGPGEKLQLPALVESKLLARYQQDPRQQGMLLEVPPAELDRSSRQSRGRRHSAAAEGAGGGAQVGSLTCSWAAGTMGDTGSQPGLR